MTTFDENVRLALIEGESPMGAVFRHYWLPFALAEELPEPDTPPIRVQLLGEDLVAFRDSTGAVGLLEAHCPHRRAPLFFGRNEECGLRCVYHGWKFDVTGACVDMPSEPDYSHFRMRIRAQAYPTFEGGGLLWAYLGSAPPPPPPAYEWVGLPASERAVAKILEHCNYLQCVEGGIDTSHSSFLHNNALGAPPGLRGRDRHPRLEVEQTEFGLRCASLRQLGEGRIYARVTNLILPSINGIGQTINDSGTHTEPMGINLFWVPLTNTTTAIYNIIYRLDREPLAPGVAAAHFAHFGVDEAHRVPGSYWTERSRANDYLLDRSVQRHRTFTGIEGIQVQDFAMQEGMGEIAKRSLEHLGSSDAAIIAARRLLLETMDDVRLGRSPRAVDPEVQRRVRPADKFLEPGENWKEAVRDQLEALT